MFGQLTLIKTEPANSRAKLSVFCGQQLYEAAAAVKLIVSGGGGKC